MEKNTCTYNGRNLYDLAFIRILKYQPLMAPLRKKQIIVPSVSGAYDFKSENHDNRFIRLECLVERPISPSQFDNLKYTLSRKGKIVFWDEPDRHYIGMPYNFDEVIEYMYNRAKTFELLLECEPYAEKREPTVLKGKKAVLPIEYEGTRQTPTRITIRNTGKVPIQGISIHTHVKSQ